MLDILTGRGGAAAPRPAAPPARPEPAVRDDAFAPTLAGALRNAPHPRPVAPRDAAGDRARRDLRSDAFADAQARIRSADVRRAPQPRDAAPGDDAAIATTTDDAPRTATLAGDARSLPLPLDDAPALPEAMAPIAPLADDVTPLAPIEAQSPIAALPTPEAESLPAAPDDAPTGEPAASWQPMAPYVVDAMPLPIPMPSVDAESSMPTPLTDDERASPGDAAPSDVTTRGDVPTTGASTLAAVAPAVASTSSRAESATPATAFTSRSAALAGAAAAADAREAAAMADLVVPTSAEPGTPGATTAVRGPAGIVRDLSALDPEFRAKLERVIARMESEHGHDVTVTETLRSQARQDALYAQGRTTDGPVVTWTRSSKHARGLAADLVIDGTYDNAAGYARLARIAKEEGLRTLAPKDPGHVELPGRGAGLGAPSMTGEAVAAQALEALVEDASRDGHAADVDETAPRARLARVQEPTAPTGEQLARVADVAQVARVARPAEVARVAEVAEPGRAARERHDTTPQPAIAPLAPIADAAGAGAVEGPRAAAGVEQMERVAKLLDLQATQGARPLNGVLLRMDRGAGLEDVIRVGMRGTSVEASLGIGDPAQAAAMSGRVNELRAALERRGLAADGLVVQPTRATDRVELGSALPATPEVQALRALADAALQQQMGGRDPEAQRRALQQEQSPFAPTREERKPTQERASDDARRQPRRGAQEDRR